MIPFIRFFPLYGMRYAMRQNESLHVAISVNANLDEEIHEVTSLSKGFSTLDLWSLAASVRLTHFRYSLW